MPYCYQCCNSVSLGTEIPPHTSRPSEITHKGWKRDHSLTLILKLRSAWLFYAGLIRWSIYKAVRTRIHPLVSLQVSSPLKMGLWCVFRFSYVQIKKGVVSSLKNREVLNQLCPSLFEILRWVEVFFVFFCFFYLAAGRPSKAGERGVFLSNSSDRGAKKTSIKEQALELGEKLSWGPQKSCRLSQWIMYNFIKTPN